MNYETIETALRAAKTSVNTALTTIETAKMQDQAVPVHVRIGRYFKFNGNKPTHYTAIAEAINALPHVVRSRLSTNWKFRNTSYGSGRWKMRTSNLRQVQ